MVFRNNILRNLAAWVEFIRGVKGPPVPEDAPVEPEPPTVLESTGLVLQAEEMTRAGDLALVDAPGDAKPGAAKPGEAARAVAPGAAGGTLRGTFRTSRSGEYALTLRVGPGTRPLRVRVDGGEFLDVESPTGAAAEVGPRVVLDGGKPVEGRRGRLVVEGDAVRLDGREGVARFLAAADLAHTRIDAVISTPPVDDPARDDAWLLFDCLDEENGRFFGISDAGRKVVMGVVEAGRPRVLKSVPMPAGAAAERLSVELTAGVAVGRLDGKPVAFVNFDRLQAGRFGFLTHGVMTVKECVAKHGAEEVHRLRPSLGGVFALRRASHSIEIQLPPGAGALDALIVKEMPR
jgi:hypothetical protein